MQPINFIKIATPKKYKAIRIWFMISALTMLMIILAITSLQLLQWYMHRSLANEKQLLAHKLQTFDAIMAKERMQRSARELLSNKLTSIHQHITQPKNPADLLKYIKTTLKTSAQLEFISLQDKNIEIKIASENTASLVKIADALSQQQTCNGLCITALEHTDKNKIRAVLKA